MKHPSARIALLVLLVAITVVSFVKSSKATGNISKGDLAGSWVLTAVGNTGCGISSELATISLTPAGTGTATLQTHGQCADSTLTGQSFTILSLKTNGEGTAGLSCGSGCGWTFTFQVSPDRSTMTLVDVTDPGNFLSGTAVHQ
jgi:hypothetical protein